MRLPWDGQHGMYGRHGMGNRGSINYDALSLTGIHQLTGIITSIDRDTSIHSIVLIPPRKSMYSFPYVFFGVYDSA